MREKVRPKKQKAKKSKGKASKGKTGTTTRKGRPARKTVAVVESTPPSGKRGSKKIKLEQEQEDVDHLENGEIDKSLVHSRTPNLPSMDTDDIPSEALHMSTMQVKSLSELVACKECGESVHLGVRPTTKGMINEFTVTCRVCMSHKSTNTPNIIRERKRKREKMGVMLQKTENINYAHVAAFLDNGLGYSGLRHYCKYLNARCLNEATFIVYARQVISDVSQEAEEFLQQNARIVRKAFESQLENDELIDLTVSYTTTYHQWGSDFCLVAGAVIELQTGLVLDYDVANMYCHVCKINAKRIVNMTPNEMTEWFNKHQDTCEIREWCDEIDQDAEEGVKEIDPKYLESFIAKKIWARSVDKFGFRYSTMIHESDEKIHDELFRSAPYGDIPVLIDNVTNCFSRRKSEHARTSFQNKLKSKCPRERVQTKDRILYVYSMSIPEYNKFAIGSNIKLRGLVKRMEEEEQEMAELLPQIYDTREVVEGEAEDGAIFVDSEGFVHPMEDAEEGELINQVAQMVTNSDQMEVMEQDEPEVDEEVGSPPKPTSPRKVKVEATDSEEVLDDDADSVTSERDEFLPKKKKVKLVKSNNIVQNGLEKKSGSSNKKTDETGKPFRVEVTET